MLQQHRPAFGDGVVAEPLFLHREVPRRVGEVFRMPAFVEERAPVVRTADRLDDEHDAIGHLDRCTEGTRALVRALFEVERHVLLGAQVDAQVLERAFERGNHPVRGEHRIPLGCTEEAWHVPALRLRERDADARAEELVRPLLVEPLRRVEKRPITQGQVLRRCLRAKVCAQRFCFAGRVPQRANSATGYSIFPSQTYVVTRLLMRCSQRVSSFLPASRWSKLRSALKTKK